MASESYGLGILIPLSEFEAYGLTSHQTTEVRDNRGIINEIGKDGNLRNRIIPVVYGLRSIVTGILFPVVNEVLNDFDLTWDESTPLEEQLMKLKFPKISKSDFINGLTDHLWRSRYSLGGNWDDYPIITTRKTPTAMLSPPLRGLRIIESILQPQPQEDS
jgi:hypothetical protein